MKWETRPQKSQAREYLFSTTRFVSRSSLWMPAAECLDVQLAFDKGILDRDSRLIAVERDPMVFASLRKTLREIACDRKLRHEPVLLNQPLHNVALDHSLDFVFLDLCGAYDAPVLSWIEYVLAPRLTSGADLAVTCTYAKRNSNFLQDCRDTMVHQWRALYDEFAHSHDYFDRHNDEREYEPIVVPALLLKFALCRYDSRMRQPKCYGDDMPMIAFKISDIQAHPGQPHYPSFSELYMRTLLLQQQSAQPIRNQQSSTTRSEAARKAVETRRRRAVIGG
jgi:predicted O-methyltransferase YrrM